jgi:hypothetical protein
MLRVPSVTPVMNYYVLWGHRKPVYSVLPVHSLLLLSRTGFQCPKCSISGLAPGITVQKKKATAAQRDVVKISVVNQELSIPDTNSTYQHILEPATEPSIKVGQVQKKNLRQNFLKK